MWKIDGGLHYYYSNKFDYNCEKNTGFDLDGTLKRNEKETKKAINNWDILYVNIENKLKEVQKTSNIVIVTNQYGITKLKDEKIKEEFCEKCILFLNKLKIEKYAIFIAYEKDTYRKPFTGISKYIQLISYCGDAAGRENDFSNTDYKFAINLGIEFNTPEQYFLQKKEKLHYPNYLQEKPCSTLDNGIPKPVPLSSIEEKFHSLINFINQQTQQMLIVMIGPQCSGKSTIVDNLIMHLGFVKCSNDVDGKDCKKKAKKLIENELNVVIDNTNPSKKTRDVWTSIKKDKIIKIFIEMKIKKELVNHLNNYRYFSQDTKLIPKVAINVFFKNYECPTKDEYDYYFDFEFIPIIEYIKDIDKYNMLYDL